MGEDALEEGAVFGDDEGLGGHIGSAYEVLAIVGHDGVGQIGDDFVVGGLVFFGLRQGADVVYSGDDSAILLIRIGIKADQYFLLRCHLALVEHGAGDGEEFWFFFLYLHV